MPSIYEVLSNKNILCSDETSDWLRLQPNLAMAWANCNDPDWMIQVSVEYPRISGLLNMQKGIELLEGILRAKFPNGKTSLDRLTEEFDTPSLLNPNGDVDAMATFEFITGLGRIGGETNDGIFSLPKLVLLLLGMDDTNSIDIEIAKVIRTVLGNPFEVKS